MPNTLGESTTGFSYGDRTFSNPIINGSFNIWQRNSNFASIATSAYSADRWQYGNTSAAVHTISRSTSVPTIGTFFPTLNYCLNIACGTADASVAAGDAVTIGTKIEGYNIAGIAQKPFVLSFWVYSTKTGIHCIAARNSGSDRSFVAEYTINTTNTWEYKEVIISPSPSAGTWDYINGVGVNITWCLMGGSTFQTTAGTWQTGNFLATSNQVNVCDSTSNIFRLAAVRITPGKKALPFDPPPITVEITDCQRYFEKSTNYTDATVPPAAAKATTYVLLTTSIPNGGTRYLYIPYKVRKRAAIVPVTYDWSAATSRSSDSGGVTFGALSAVPLGFDENSFYVVNNFSGAGAGNPMVVSSNTVLMGWYDDAEL